MENTQITAGTQDMRNTQTENGRAEGVFEMKWHKFLIWFSLFFSALINIADGIYCFSFVDQIGSMAFFGIAEILLGLFVIFVRFRLSGFKRNAADLLTAAQAIGIVLLILSALILGLDANVSGISTGIAMLVINRVYYKKREALFRN